MPKALKNVHRTVRVFVTDHAGTHDAGAAIINCTRTCANCAHDGDRDADWVAVGGTEKWGRCMNGCSAADALEPNDHWCDSHQTLPEFNADIHRPHAPVLTLIQGS